MERKFESEAKEKNRCIKGYCHKDNEEFRNFIDVQHWFFLCNEAKDKHGIKSLMKMIAKPKSKTIEVHLELVKLVMDGEKLLRT